MSIEQKQTNTDGGNKSRDINITSAVTLLRDKPRREPNKIIEGHAPNKVTRNQQQGYPRNIVNWTRGTAGEGQVLK